MGLIGLFLAKSINLAVRLYDLVDLSNFLS